MGEKVFFAGKKKTAIQFILLNICVLIGIVLILELWKADIFRYPLEITRGGDTNQVLFNYNTMLEEGLTGISTRVGVPFVTQAIDFTTGGFLFKAFHTGIVKALGNPVAGVNTVFLIGFFLSANSAFFAMKKLRLSSAASFIGALLFAFTPFHFYRGLQHLGYSSYWTVPLFLLLCLQYIKGEGGYNKGEGKLKFLTKNNIFHILVLIFITGQGIYQSFFAGYFLVAIILYKLVNKEGLKKIKHVIADIVLCIVFFAINIIPVILSYMQYGMNTSAGSRTMAEAELYALKISSIIMPIDGHRIPALSALKYAYTEGLPNNNENLFAAVGLIGAIGFVWLLLTLIKRKKNDENVHAASVINAFALLLAVIGGLSSIISLVFTSIRGYNRISIYIAFLSLVSAGVILDKIFGKVKKKPLIILILLVVLGFGLFDQTSKDFVPQYADIKVEWDADDAFIKEIEAMEEKGAMIYQLPYVSYPEEPPVVNMEDYSHLIGVLHSDSLKWSYGAYKGRMGDDWNKYISEFSTDELVKQIKIAGFAGIYVDSYAYTNSDFMSLHMKLKSITGVVPVVSDDGRHYYYSLQYYNGQITSEDILKASIYYKMDDDGFYGLETDGENKWRWCKQSGDMIFYNTSDKPIEISLSGEFSIIVGEGHKLTISCGDESKVYAFNGEDTPIEFNCSIKPGKNVIHFETNAPEVNVGEDPRDLCFNLINFEYNIIK